MNQDKNKLPSITHCDPADLPKASVEHPPEERCLEAFCDRCNNVVDAVCPKCKSNVSPAGYTTKDGAAGSLLPREEFYRRLLHLFGAARNPKFMLVCYYLATGDGYADGVTMREVARKFGVCKGTVSKHCVAICQHLGMKPSQYMTKEEHIEKFRQSNRRPTKTSNSKSEISKPKSSNPNQ